MSNLRNLHVPCPHFYYFHVDFKMGPCRMSILRNSICHVVYYLPPVDRPHVAWPINGHVAVSYLWVKGPTMCLCLCVCVNNSNHEFLPPYSYPLFIYIYIASYFQLRSIANRILSIFNVNGALEMFKLQNNLSHSSPHISGASSLQRI